MLKNCEICGKEYESGKGNRKVCSDECKTELKVKTLRRQMDRKNEKRRTGNSVGRPKKHKEHRYTPNENETKCWSCKKYYKSCNWSKDFKPVMGWKADEIKIKHHNDKEKPVFTDSYFVRECPEYIQEERRGK